MSRKRSKTHPAGRQPRPPRRIHDEAREGASDKLPEIAGCPQCGASYRNGRWTWKTPPAGAYEHVCPACQRIADDYPAGRVQLAGRFVAAHRDELVGLLRHVEERERGEHPLKRIIRIRDEDEGLVVTVTDSKLADALGRALQSAYEGKLEHPPTAREPGNLFRVHWTRD